VWGRGLLITSRFSYRESDERASKDRNPVFTSRCTKGESGAAHWVWPTRNTSSMGREDEEGRRPRIEPVSPTKKGKCDERQQAQRFALGRGGRGDSKDGLYLKDLEGHGTLRQSGLKDSE